jgi:dTMP kinase
VPKGRFITFEGGEGAGKSTQVKRLVKLLQRHGIDAIASREPGGSPGAEAIRELLVSGSTSRWEPLAEALLHVAARREHVVHVVWPALERGVWVVCDRFADSTMAYQGYGQGADRAAISQLHRAAFGSFEPDLSFVLDLPVAAGLARAAKRDAGTSNRYERMDQAMHERVRQGFLAIARDAPKRCVVLDAALEPDSVAAQVRRELSARLGVKVDG